MDPTDLTVEILKGIRDGVHSTNERLDGLHDEVHALRADTNERLGRVERRLAETEVRLSTELVAVVGAVRETRDLLREDHALRGRVDDHERRIAAMESRVG
jgi:hypothetical protein